MYITVSIDIGGRLPVASAHHVPVDVPNVCDAHVQSRHSPTTF